MGVFLKYCRVAHSVDSFREIKDKNDDVRIIFKKGDNGVKEVYERCSSRSSGLEGRLVGEG